MVEDNESVQRDLGRMEAQIKSLGVQVSALQVQMSAIQLTLNEARGGWKTLMLLGGGASILGATVSKFFHIPSGWP